MLHWAIDYITTKLLIKILNYYRLLIASTLLIYSLPIKSFGPVGFTFSPALITSLAYLLIAIFSLTQRHRLSNFAGYVLIMLSIDTISISVIAHLLGGIHNGVPALLLATVAFGNIFFQRAAGYFIAAVSSICILFSVFLNTLGDDSYVKYYFPTSVLCSIFFIESFILQILIRNLSFAQEQIQEKEKQAHTIEQLNTLIVNKMQTGVVIFDEQLNIIAINDSAIELSRNELEKKSSLIGSRYETPARDFLDTQQDKTTLKDENNSFEIAINFAKPDLSDSINVAFFTNLRELKQKAQLIKLSSLGHLSASIAHEIRNPLTAIHQANQLLMESEAIDKNDKKLFDIINNNVSRINNIVEDTSSISKRQAAAPQDIVLKEFLEQLITEIKSTQRFDNIEYTLEIPKNLTIQFDKTHLQQVLTNLIENGLAFSKENTEVASIKVVAIETESGFTCLQFFDQGPGIEKANQPHIFEPFFSKRPGGSGLGLYISKELCELNQAMLEYHHNDAKEHYFEIVFAHPKKNLST